MGTVVEWTGEWGGEGGEVMLWEVGHMAVR